MHFPFSKTDGHSYALKRSCPKRVITYIKSNHQKIPIPSLEKPPINLTTPHYAVTGTVTAAKHSHADEARLAQSPVQTLGQGVACGVKPEVIESHRFEALVGCPPKDERHLSVVHSSVVAMVVELAVIIVVTVPIDEVVGVGGAVVDSGVVLVEVMVDDDVEVVVFVEDVAVVVVDEGLVVEEEVLLEDEVVVVLVEEDSLVEDDVVLVEEAVVLVLLVRFMKLSYLLTTKSVASLS